MDDAARAQIRRLLETGLTTEQVARELGVPKGTVSAVKAHVTMGSYGASPSGAGSLSEADVEELEDAADLKFGLERDLHDALRRNIHQLDPTLRIVDHGKERRVEAGFIDILAEDDQDSLACEARRSGLPVFNSSRTDSASHSRLSRPPPTRSDSRRSRADALLALDSHLCLVAAKNLGAKGPELLQPDVHAAHK